MVGIVITAHKHQAEALLSAAKFIMPIGTHVLSVSFHSADDFDDVQRKIEIAIRSADSGDGVLLLTDLYGGTPANAALKASRKHKVQILTGVNLAIVIEALTHRNELNLEDLTKKVLERSKAFIQNANNYKENH